MEFHFGPRASSGPYKKNEQLYATLLLKLDHTCPRVLNPHLSSLVPVLYSPQKSRRIDLGFTYIRDMGGGHEPGMRSATCGNRTARI